MIIDEREGDQTDQGNAEESRNRAQHPRNALKTVSYHDGRVDGRGARQDLRKAECHRIFFRRQPFTLVNDDVEQSVGYAAKADHPDGHEPEQ